MSWMVTFPASAARTWTSSCQEAIASHDQAQCNRVKVFGHRGAEGPASGTNENTLRALHKDHRLKVGCETDTWRLASDSGEFATGVSVIFHDPTLGRVVSTDSLARAGLTPTTQVNGVTLEQFRMLRTKGGEPLPTLRQWIRYSGKWQVRCKVEVKNAPRNPARVAGWVTKYRAPATFYGSPWSAGLTQCSQNAVLSMLAVGEIVGLKYNANCPMTMAQIAQAGYSYTTLPSLASLTKTAVADAHAQGLAIGVSSGSDRTAWTQLVEAGVNFIIVGHPGALKKWLHSNI